MCGSCKNNECFLQFEEFERLVVQWGKAVQSRQLRFLQRWQEPSQKQVTFLLYASAWHAKCNNAWRKTDDPCKLKGEGNDQRQWRSMRSDNYVANREGDKQAIVAKEVLKKIALGLGLPECKTHKSMLSMLDSTTPSVNSPLRFATFSWWTVVSTTNDRRRRKCIFPFIFPLPMNSHSVWQFSLSILPKPRDENTATNTPNFGNDVLPSVALRCL